MMRWRAVFRSLMLTIVSVGGVRGSNFNAPHSHTGTLPPFAPGDPKVELDSRARSILSSGESYQTTIHLPGTTSGRGLVVQDVHAPPDVVWARILDFDNYSQMVPKTFESTNYNVTHSSKKTRRGGGGNDSLLEQIIYTKMKIGLPLIPKLTFYIKHLYYPEMKSLTWTLDYEKSSDFDDSVGYWYVTDHPDMGRDWSRVYYSASVSVYDWVPKTVVNFLSTKALTDATGWVKKYSEEKWRDDPRRRESAEAASATEEKKTRSLSRAKKKRRGFGGLFFRTGGNAGNDKNDMSENTCDSVESITMEGRSNFREEKLSKPSEMLTAKAAWTRVALVMLVSSLLVYNISLFLDRMTQ